MGDALAVLQAVPEREHLWHAARPETGAALREALGLLAGGLRHAAGRRLRQETQTCLECVQTLHEYLELEARETGLDPAEWERVHAWLEEDTERRLEEQLVCDRERFVADKKLPPALLTALIEVLNFPYLLERASLFRKLEQFLLIVLSDARISFPTQAKNGGLLILCASSHERIRRWAMEHVSKLGNMDTEDDILYVLDPALQVFLAAVRDQRVSDSMTEGADGMRSGPSGLVVFHKLHFYNALWHVLQLVTQSALARYGAQDECAPRFVELVHVVFLRVDESDDATRDIWALRTLASLLEASSPAVWQADHDGAVSFKDALEMLFAKVHSSYHNVSKKAMEFLLVCLRNLCSCAPPSVRNEVQDRTIQFLLCDFVDRGDGKDAPSYASEAQRVAVFIIGAGCKAGFLPTKTEPLWAQPLLSLALAHNGPCSVLEWVLRRVKKPGLPVFPQSWKAVLSSRSKLPDKLHLCLWQAHAQFLQAAPAGDTELDSIRDLFAQYLLTRVPPDGTWVAQAVRYCVFLMICMSKTLVPAAHRFFQARVQKDPALVREAVNGEIFMLQKSPPSRMVLGLHLRALNVILSSALKLNLSIAAVSDALVPFLSRLDAQPPLSSSTAKSLLQTLIVVARNCARERVPLLRSVLDMVKNVDGLDRTDLDLAATLIPSDPAAKERKLPGWITHAPITKPSLGAAAPVSREARAVKAAVVTAPQPPARKGATSSVSSASTGSAMASSTPIASSSSSGSAPSIFIPAQPNRFRDIDDDEVMLQRSSSLNKPKRRGKVISLNASSAGSPMASRIRVDQETPQEIARKRLLPSRSSLLERVLSWRIEDLIARKLDPELHLQPVPESFQSPDHYSQVFEPLLLAEVRSSMERDLEDMPEGGWQSMELGDVNRTGNLFSIKLTLEVEKGEIKQGSSKGRMRGLWSTDDILQMQPASGGGDSVLALVVSVDWSSSRRTDELRVTVCPGKNRTVTWVPLWKVRQVSSLVTAGREYRSMMSLAHLPVRDFILSGKALGGAGVGGANQVFPKLLHRRFNESQTDAILTCLRQDGRGFVLIQGPPGTGKTRTILGIIGSLVMAAREQQVRGGRRKRILVCAASNRAVDEVASRLLGGIWDPFRDRQEELTLVRLGREDAVSPAVQPVLLESLARARCAGRVTRHDSTYQYNSEKLDSLQANEWNIDLQIQELEGQQVSKVKLRSSTEEMYAAGPSQDEKELSVKIQRLYEQKRSIRQLLKQAKDNRTNAVQSKKLDKKSATEDVLREADVVCATLSGAGSDMLVKLDLEFDAVIVDEATQATELQTLIPLKYRSRLCVLVGDPRQLPATVLSMAAQESYFSQSLFQRLQKIGTPVKLLNVQYRMHPKIAAFPNQMFYDGQLRNGASVVSQRYDQPYHRDPLFQPFLFIDVASTEERSASHSALNRGEANMAADLVTEFYRRFGAKHATGGLGIITPYRQQMYELKQTVLPRLKEAERNQVDINTIDGFQGCEKDLIVFSCVRSHKGSEIGFLDDVRRLNVGVTRARFCLIVLGNARLLSQHTTFQALIENAKNANAFLTEQDVRTKLRDAGRLVGKEGQGGGGDGRAAALAKPSSGPARKTATGKPVPPKPAATSKSAPPAASKSSAVPPNPPTLFVPPKRESLDEDIERNRKRAEPKKRRSTIMLLPSPGANEDKRSKTK